RTGIIARIATMENVSPDMIGEVKESLNQLFSTWKRAGGESAGELVPQFRDKTRLSDIQTVANVWARPDQAPRHPGLVVHQMGAGKVFLSVLPLTASNPDLPRCPWPRVLAQNCVRYLLGQPLVCLNGYGEVETVLCRQPNRMVLHFLNHRYGAGEEIPASGEEETLRALPVRLSAALREQVRAAELAPENVPIPLTPEGFVLPELGVYQAVVLRY
ncbi:MAG: hypothetical protein QHJ73_15105, partial [Armatimonadota bacterium]|nr:hypothetical protein [Armatimonadota bacterium]